MDTLANYIIQRARLRGFPLVRNGGRVKDGKKTYMQLQCSLRKGSSKNYNIDIESCPFKIALLNTRDELEVGKFVCFHSHGAIPKCQRRILAADVYIEEEEEFAEMVKANASDKELQEYLTRSVRSHYHNLFKKCSSSSGITELEVCLVYIYSKTCGLTFVLQASPLVADQKLVTQLKSKLKAAKTKNAIKAGRHLRETETLD